MCLQACDFIHAIQQHVHSVMQEAKVTGGELVIVPSLLEVDVFLLTLW